MGEYKKLFNTSMIFAIGNMGSKLITFLMLPLYTFALSTTEYGVVDLMITTTSLLLPIVGLSIFESVLRFGMDQKENPRVVFSNGVYVTILASVLIGILMLFATRYNDKFIYLSMLLIIQLFQNVFSQYSKAIGKINIFAINGILLSFATAILNIVFLVVFKMGITGYLISLVFANLISVIYLSYTLDVFKIYNQAYVSRSDIIKLLKFSIPLIPNSIAWWLTVAVGRYFILLFVGAAGNGIYAVANKIPMLLTVFTTIFSQAWQISAIESYENEKSENIFGEVYNFYFFTLFIGSAILIILIKPMMRILVNDAFFASWEYVPFLLLAVIFSSVSNFLGTQYTVMKDTAGILKTTILGAIVNVVLLILLLPTVGLQGVGIGSFVSSFVVWLIRHIQISNSFEFKHNTMKIIFSTFLLVFQTIFLILNYSKMTIVIHVCVLICLLFIYYTEIKNIFFFLKMKINKNDN